MVRKKIMLGVAAIATATALVFGASSFDKKPEIKVAPNSVFATKYFKFIGSAPSDYYLASKWQESNNPITPCEGADLTCTVSSTTLVDANALANYLSNPGGTPRNPQVNSSDGVTYHIDSKLDQ